MRSPLVSAAILAALVSVSGGSVGPGSGPGLVTRDVRLEQVTNEGAVEALPAPRLPARTAATWCGTPTQVDRRPNTISGSPVHWIYVLPSDAPDRFSTFASRMQTDAEAIDAWWRREDPVRTPRNDLTQLSCGAQLDLTVLRLPQTSAQLTPEDSRFVTLFNALPGLGFGSTFTKHLVYFDGPVAQADLCGQGASLASGFGVAAIYVQACSGAPSSVIAAHELLHTLGAVPRGAPHRCPEAQGGHTCDSASDLMHPFLDAAPLDAKLLDPGRDDYYGHAAAFTDSQDAAWLVQLDRQQPFTVTISGPGGVTADVPGLDCAQSCTTTWNTSTRLGLTAVPRPGAKLVRWNGVCTGASTCVVTVAPGAAVSALFAPAVYRLSVAVSGRGAVRSSRAGITCRPRCSAAFPSFVPVGLTATPAKGWRFRSWSGACRGTRPTCTVPMTAAASAKAIFSRA
ncbi:MAG: InlB B-repeat-containing protein [Gaiellaceae bacterium]